MSEAGQIPGSGPKVAILLDAHRMDALVFHQFRLLSEALEPDVSVFAVIHAPNGEHREEDRVLVLNDADIFPAGRRSKPGAQSMLPGNPDLKLVLATRLLPRHDAYLRLESDVVCSTPIRETCLRLIQKCAGQDFVAKEIASQRNMPNWMWWSTFSAPTEVMDNLGPDRMWKAFLPMLYFSRAFIEGYGAALEDGWDGHYEVSMPTYAKFAGLRFADFRKLWPKVSHHATFDVHRLARLAPNGFEFHHPVKRIEDLIELQGLNKLFQPQT